MSLKTSPSSSNAGIAQPIDLLRNRVTGTILTETSPEYDAARALPDFTANPRPYAIVQVATVEDVAATVDFARESGIPLSVRSGGHSLGQFSVVDDAVVVDFSKMKAMTVDPATGVARVQAGATSGDIATAASPHGFALSTGDTASVGIGGLATGGGVGLMVRKYGLTIDNLLSAEVVLADGRIVTASKNEHPDLFWAIRGGGGNFGIVTEFTFQLAPVTTVLGGALVLPATRDVIRGYLQYSVTAPDDLTAIVNIMHAPPVPFIPADHVGEVVAVILVVWSGNLQKGEQALAPLRALATPVADTIHPIPYGEIFRYTDHQSAPHGEAVRMMLADELSDSTIDEILAAVTLSTSPFDLVQLRGLGGAMARIAPDATAFAVRNQPYLVSIMGLWLDPADDGRPHQQWTQQLWAKIRGDCTGAYANFLGKDEEDRIHEAYPGATYERLASIKQIYDPENFFRFNENIEPRA